MSRGWDAALTYAGWVLDQQSVEHVADALVDVDYMPPVAPECPRPAPEAMATIPARLLDVVRADAVCLRDRARGERALAAPPGTPEAKVGDVRVAIWSSQNPGIAELLDWIGGT